MPLRLIIAAALFLTACGADGPPLRPSAKSTSGISLTGEVGVGVVTQ